MAVDDPISGVVVSEVQNTNVVLDSTELSPEKDKSTAPKNQQDGDSDSHWDLLGFKVGDLPSGDVVYHDEEKDGVGCVSPRPRPVVLAF